MVLAMIILVMLNNLLTFNYSAFLAILIGLGLLGAVMPDKNAANKNDAQQISELQFRNALDEIKKNGNLTEEDVKKIRDAVDEKKKQEKR